ncbi:MAG: CehA/McbA family metallohydrolase, partial [Clostridia bacterium]|nr:CehA/McbA family metallohydrolase [Clostridia bacterium]
MFKRYELHNHTTESDAGITCRELIDHMLADGVDCFAITDHNTVSGQPIIRKILAEEHLPIACAYGMEYTTYFGHIVCPVLEQYVPWDSINKKKPELLFEAAKRAGAVTGVAHPFSYGDPFARGCRFEMEITDFSNVDDIEIINNPEPLHEVNEPGILWWESLVLSGVKVAACAGMDLHGLDSMAMKFATYA